MRTYTIEEAIEEMKSTVQVFGDGYSTWKVKANLGLRSTGEFAEDYFTTHDEAWKTGEFDGERFNPQDYEEWLDDFYRHEFAETLTNYAKELITEDIKKQLFDEYCDIKWNDSANEDNYEPSDQRDERAARKIIESWIYDNEWPDNVVVTADNSIIYVLDEDEKSFAESETANLGMLVDGCTKAFIDAYDNRENT